MSMYFFNGPRMSKFRKVSLISADQKRKSYREYAELEQAEKLDEDINLVDRSNNRNDKVDKRTGKLGQ